MKFYIGLAVVAIVAVVLIKRSKKTEVDKVNEEVATKQKASDAAVAAGIIATPPLSMRGEEPLTTFNAAPTVAKIEQGVKAVTQWFPRFGEIWN